MIVTCEQCQTRYNLDKTQIKNKAHFKVRCSKCGYKFEVEGADSIEMSLRPDEVVKTEWDWTISISNQKGGVAKTSTCMNLGNSLAMMGKRVLLIDLDVQANLTISLGYPANTSSFFDILQSGTNAIAEYIQTTEYQGLDLLPSNSRMALLGKHYMHKQNFEFLLQEQLTTLAGRYDFIIIDTPPALDFCTLNAIMASHCVIIPTPCEYLSLHGINRVADIIKIVQNRAGRKIDHRILITMFDVESTAARVIFQKIKDMFQKKVLQTVIDLDQRLKESQIVHLPVYQYDTKSSSASQYQELAREIDLLTSL